MPDGSEKTCVLCGESCVGQPRIKDAKGRYYHKACHEQALRRKQQREQEQQQATDAFVAAEPPPVSDGDDEVMSMLLDDADPAAPPVADSGSTCPSCGQGVAPGAVLCVNCGFNLQSGHAVQTAIASGLPATDSGGNTKWPIVIGVISIVLAVLNLGCSGFNVISSLGDTNVPGLIGVGVFILLEAWLLLAGIGLVRRTQEGYVNLRRWSITMTILLCTCFAFLFIVLFMARSSFDENLPPEFSGLADLVFVLLGVAAVWHLFWPVFCFVWTGRDQIRSEVAQW